MRKSDFILAAKKTAYIYQISRKIIETRLSLPIPKYDNCYITSRDIEEFIKSKMIDSVQEINERYGLPISLEEIEMCLEGLCDAIIMQHEKPYGYVLIEAISIFAYNKAIRLALYQNSLDPLSVLKKRLETLPNDRSSLFLNYYIVPQKQKRTMIQSQCLE